ncbi:hypothetical protein CsSME_00038796 [Camellia sinensis var. sinensis]|uniref:Uncharacterized protein n=1 Tax=Camellia sinensis var. sinensis TaxID=542762 RepID=A0A4S4DQF9_CAMSN|nr:UPF0481 protein At3g47200-like [Camellia sinensis]THG05343.1 hypothetical protein TEA_003016 [Camellia sinensis var. sinensis]
MSNDNQVYKKSKSERKRDDWIISINDTLAMVEKHSNLSIYKVPNKLLKLKEDAYTPSIVSIGPFHHNNKAMQAFAEHKWRYMLHLFMRISQAAESDSTHQKCAAEILKLQGEARRCYSNKIGLDEYKLAEILLVDGCFLLELFLKYSENHEEDKVEDPLINNDRTIATLQHDLALLENQIPFSVLETLFDIMKDHVPQPLFTEHNVATLALHFFKSALGLRDEAIRSKSSKLSGKHLLDILHKFYLHASLKRRKILHKSHLPISDITPYDDDDRQRLLINGFENCATQLLKTGIQFQGKTDTTPEENFLDIEFTTEVVKMPLLEIREATESIFRNLIVFEQCSIDTSHCITSYIFLMRSLLNSSHDAEILHHRKIIGYDLSGGGSRSHEDVATLFKSMCDGVVLKDFCFSDLCTNVNKYSRSWLDWRRLRAIVKVKWREYMIALPRDYFTNPWTTISVIAAIVLLGFTALQTYYTVRSYYPH